MDQATFNSEEKVVLEGSHVEAEEVEGGLSRKRCSRPKHPRSKAPVLAKWNRADQCQPGDGVHWSHESASGEATLISSTCLAPLTQMIANAPASDFSADAEVDLSNVANLPRSAKTMQIISNILKNQQDANNHILENRRGADAETEARHRQRMGST